jgi:hypothetical protein
LESFAKVWFDQDLEDKQVGFWDNKILNAQDNMLEFSQNLVMRRNARISIVAIPMHYWIIRKYNKEVVI